MKTKNERDRKNKSIKGDYYDLHLQWGNLCPDRVGLTGIQNRSWWVSVNTCP